MSKPFRKRVIIEKPETCGKCPFYSDDGAWGGGYKCHYIQESVEESTPVNRESLGDTNCIFNPDDWKF